MTTDWIARSADRLLNEIDDIEGEAMQDGQREQDMQATIDTWMARVSAIIAAEAPGHHDIPNALGRWVSDKGKVITVASQEHLDWFAESGVPGSWYGPIPDREETQPERTT